MVFDSLAINAAFGMALPYKAEMDLVPVIHLANVPLVLIVNAEQVPMKTLPEIVAHAKANPRLVHVRIARAQAVLTRSAFCGSRRSARWMRWSLPYRGVNPALQDVIAGQIKGHVSRRCRCRRIHQVGASFARLQSPQPRVSRARLTFRPSPSRAIRNTISRHSMALAAPKGTPPAIVSKLNQEINKALQLPEMRTKIDPTGAEITGGITEGDSLISSRTISAKFKKIVSLTNASAK